MNFYQEKVHVKYELISNDKESFIDPIESYKTLSHEQRIFIPRVN